MNTKISDAKASRKTEQGIETKICPACRRPFENRKRWRSRGLWEQVRYCSERCRRVKAKDL